MALPPTVRVKLSSEAAESISLTPVVVQEMPVRELVEHMLGVTGKDEARIRELLLRGTLVSGASRFRWAGWEARCEDLRELLATFPDPDPARAVRRGALRARDPARRPAGDRDPARGRRRARDCSSARRFWDLLMEVIVRGSARTMPGTRIATAPTATCVSSAAAETERLRARQRRWCGTARCATRSASVAFTQAETVT